MQYNNVVEVRVGKEGVTEEVNNHLRELLEEHEVLKVKFLKNTEVDADSLPGKIVKSIGRKVVLVEE